MSATKGNLRYETLANLVAAADSGTWGEEGSPHNGDPVLRSTNISDYSLDLTEPAWRVISSNDRQRRKLQTGDIIVTKSSGSPEHIGKCCIFTDPQDGRSYYFSNFMLRLRADATKADHRWLFYWLTSERGRAVLQQMNSTTTGLRNLSVPLYLQQSVPVPPLSEQKRIAAILDKADAIRRRRQEALAEYEVMLQSTFLEVVGPGASTYLRWPRTKIENLAERKAGSMRTGPFGSDLRHSEFVGTGIAVLGIDNAVQNRFAWDERRFVTPKKYENLRRYTVYPNDVIITIMGTIGRSAVVPDDIPPAITTKHLASITLNRKMAEPEFVSNAIHRHPEILRQLGATQRGAIMSGLNLGIIRNLELPTPPIEVQRTYAKITRQIRQQENHCRTLMSEINDLFSSLVQRAFRGEL